MPTKHCDHVEEIDDTVACINEIMKDLKAGPEMADVEYLITNAKMLLRELKELRRVMDND